MIVRVYLLVSLSLLAALGLLLLLHGRQSFYFIQGPPDAASVAMKFAAFAIGWTLLGLLIVSRHVMWLWRKHSVFLVALLLIGFLYLNAIREPHRVDVGDFRAYFLAAVDIQAKRPIDQQAGRLYLYPPLLAVILQPTVNLGLTHLAVLFRFANFAAILLLSCLIYLTLQRCGFSRESAAAVVFLAVCPNVPILRTLIYNQVNMHVVNLVLVSVLLWPRLKALSALALTLAIHLKVYPVAFTIVFLWSRQWSWLFWFVVSNLGIVGITSLAGGFHYYIDFFAQISQLKETGIRNTSVDSLVYNTARILGIAPVPEGLVLAGKLGLIAVLARPLAAAMNSAMFTEESGQRDSVLKAYLVLPVAMLVISPTIWEHYPVFLLPTATALVPEIRTEGQAWVFAICYAFLFLFPVNEVYPVSYLRLAAIVGLGLLMGSIAKQGTTGKATWFTVLEKRLAESRR